MRKSIYLALILALSAIPARADEINPSGYDMTCRVQIAQSEPAQTPQFDLSASVSVQRLAGVAGDAKYVGETRTPTRMTRKSISITGGGFSDTQCRPVADADHPDLACFDFANNEASGRIWLDLSSERKAKNPKCFWYRTWLKFD